tara:strand:+ start:3157 stop:3312 length:156 start_codon:yes stop_codon:yes gene_type:complete
MKQSNDQIAEKLIKLNKRAKEEKLIKQMLDSRKKRISKDDEYLNELMFGSL